MFLCFFYAMLPSPATMLFHMCICATPTVLINVADMQQTLLLYVQLLATNFTIVATTPSYLNATSMLSQLNATCGIRHPYSQPPFPPCH